ncbi:MAG: hypothetical protein J6Q76_09555 [Clostridia bacterium]|nr:hypothetical protein [Clostridia bacterium]
MHPTFRKIGVSGVFLFHDDLLFDGAKFLVEDSDGIFIAKGTIENSNLDY